MMRGTEDEREALTRQANAVREKLLGNVEELVRRGHDALDVKVQAEKHPVFAGTGLAVVLGGTTFGVVLVVHRRAHAKEARRRERMRMLARLWAHPERAARASPPFFLELVRAVALGILTTAALAPLRRLLNGYVRRLIPVRLPRLGS